MRFWEKDATLGGCRLRQNNSISFFKLEVKHFICIISRYLLCVFISPFRMRNGGSQDSGEKCKRRRQLAQTKEKNAIRRE